MSRLQQPLSHSHESLVTIEQELSGRQLSTASSANNINDHIDEDEKEEEEIGRIAGWAVGFEKMLNDVGGLAVFTEFLKKEFSDENIIFWRICEQYKSVSDSDKRKGKAKEIFAKHISVKASDPVNIDHVSRQQVEKQLDHPSINTFDKPQQEIFKLMKQDSYPRFIKSELYKTYLMREMGGEPLGLPKDDFQGILGAKELKEEKKKAAKNKDSEDKEKRRRSLLPWRQKSSKNSLKSTSDSDLKKNGGKTNSSTTKESEVNNNTTSTQKKSAPGPGIDLSTIRKEVQASTKECKEDQETDDNFKFCRVILPDGSTTVVCAKPGQRIRSVLGKLCDKRSLSIAAVDVFLLGSDKPLDLSEDISTLGSREVMIERRVLFRMDLPNRKSIGVKAKPNRSIRDVFKPILNKYGFKLDGICVELSGQPGLVDIDAQVSTIDSQRVLIKHQEDCIAISRNEGFRSKRTQLVVKYPPDFHVNASQESTSLDVITNRIFEDLMRGKSELAHNFDELGILDPENSPQVPRKGSGDHRSLGLFGLRRKESQAAGKAVEMPKVKHKHKVTFNLQKNQTRKAATQDDDKFLDLLSKVQSGRFDDQRGLDTQNSEIPEFLQNKSHHLSGRESAPPVLSGGRARADDYIKSNHEKYMSYTRGQMMIRPSSVSLDSMTFDRRNNRSDRDVFESGDFDSCNLDSPAEPLPHGNESFSTDGVIPSNAEAQEFFQAPVPDSTDFDDPCMAEKSLRDIGFDYSFNMYQAKAWGYSRHNPYAQQKLSSQETETPGDDAAFLDETLTPNDPDFDNTLISSPVQGHIRSLSVPVSLHTPANKGGMSRENGLVQTSTPLSTKSDIVQTITPLSQKSEIRNGVGDSAPSKTYSSRVSHSSAFHHPNTQVTSPPSDNKPVIIDLGDSETNITFV
ncbi:regulator of G-protein signaling 14-like [Argopecten irradians]|uniref:regulator of G-protein signaling 14-like n=1 Tax=Argopecten irradians TaxID=31199 RepID=UPI003715A69E